MLFSSRAQQDSYSGTPTRSDRFSTSRGPSSPEQMLCDENGAPGNINPGRESTTPDFLFGRRSILSKDRRGDRESSPPHSVPRRSVLFSPAVSTIQGCSTPQHSSFGMKQANMSFEEAQAEVVCKSSHPQTQAGSEQRSSAPGFPPIKLLSDTFNSSALDEESRPKMFEEEQMADDVALSDENDAPGEEHIFWVRIVGHRPDETKDVLEIFARHAELVAYHVPDGGNWIWVRYGSHIHVGQALARSGRFIKDGMLIAVFPCTEEQLPSHILAQLGKDKTSTSQSLANQSLRGTRPPVWMEKNKTLDASQRIEPFDESKMGTPRSGMRSLSAAVRSKHDTTVKTSPFPEKAPSSALSSLWNYIRP